MDAVFPTHKILSFFFCFYFSSLFLFSGQQAFLHIKWKVDIQTWMEGPWWPWQLMSRFSGLGQRTLYGLLLFNQIRHCITTVAAASVKDSEGCLWCWVYVNPIIHNFICSFLHACQCLCLSKRSWQFPFFFRFPEKRTEKKVCRLQGHISSLTWNNDVRNSFVTFRSH